MLKHSIPYRVLDFVDKKVDKKAYVYELAELNIKHSSLLGALRDLKGRHLTEDTEVEGEKMLTLTDYGLKQLNFLRNLPDLFNVNKYISFARYFCEQSRAGNTTLSQKDIRKRFHTSKPHLVQVLKDFENHGYLERQTTDAKDPVYMLHVKDLPCVQPSI